MKPVYQTVFGKHNGNCMSACIASILELELDDVPNFCAMHTVEAPMWKHCAEWLAERGLALIHYNVKPEYYTMKAGQEVYVIGRVKSQINPGGEHAVVVRLFKGDSDRWVTTEIVHDPNKKNKPYEPKELNEFMFLVPCQPIPCGTCGGERVIDSGGVQPWGEGIDIPCLECSPPLGEGTTELTVTSYDWERNEFRASTVQGEVVFDPFVICAIEQTDEQYKANSLAPSIVGHKFVVANKSRRSDGAYCPSADEVLKTTWRSDG